LYFTLDQLQALDAIARTGTFAGAASELHKVPSAISYLVQGLETALEVELFDRSRRKAVLTKEGRRILDASRDVLKPAKALNRLAVELSGGWEAELHVVVDGALPMYAMTHCLRRFADPEVPTCLRLDVEYQEGVLDRFDHAPADIGLYLGFDTDAQRKDYECIGLPELELLLVASPEHPLCQTRVTVESRAGHAELVVRDSSSRFAQQPKGSFIGSRNVVFLADFYSKRIALLEAAGYGWIPRHFIRSDLDEGTLQVLDTEANSWTYQPVVTTRKGETLGRGGRLFIESLLSFLS
jgi:DNA-binding transcriptional LysR family regulator